MITPLNIISDIKKAYHERLHDLECYIDKELKYPSCLEVFIPYKNIEELRLVLEHYKKAGWSISWIDEIEEGKVHEIRFSYDIFPTCKELENIDVIMVEISFIKMEEL